MPLSRPSLPVLLVGLLALVVAGCSNSTQRPVSSFEPGGMRVWESFDQDGDAEAIVEIRSDFSGLRIHLDCRAEEGELRVTTAVGSAGSACSSSPGSGYIDMQLPEPRDAQALDIQVQAPDGARWSAAVDAVVHVE